MSAQILQDTDNDVNPEVFCECIDCHKPMQLDKQMKWNGGFMILATCKNSVCELRYVTLTIPEYVNKTHAQFEEYREINRKNTWEARAVEVGQVN